MKSINFKRLNPSPVDLVCVVQMAMERSKKYFPVPTKKTGQTKEEFVIAKNVAAHLRNNSQQALIASVDHFIKIGKITGITIGGISYISKSDSELFLGDG